MDDEPNLYIEHGWKSPNIHWNKWLALGFQVWLIDKNSKKKPATPEKSHVVHLSTCRIQQIVDQLSMEKHRNSTKLTYHYIFTLFNQFFIRLDAKPCDWEDHLILFTGFLVENKLKSSTIKSYISAIRSVLADLKEPISENNYLLKSLTRACCLRNDVIVTKLPVTKDVLRLLLISLQQLHAVQPYLLKLYSAMLVSAYYGMLHIGKLAKSPHTILARNVHLGLNRKKFLFVLLASKTHTKGDKPQQVKVSSKNEQSWFQSGKIWRSKRCSVSI